MRGREHVRDSRCQQRAEGSNHEAVPGPATIEPCALRVLRAQPPCEDEPERHRHPPRGHLYVAQPNSLCTERETRETRGARECSTEDGQGASLVPVCIPCHQQAEGREREQRWEQRELQGRKRERKENRMHVGRLWPCASMPRVACVKVLLGVRRCITHAALVLAVFATVGCVPEERPGGSPPAPSQSLELASSVAYRSVPRVVLSAPKPAAESPILQQPYEDDFARVNLGTDYRATSPAWKLEAGRLCANGARNRPVWLRR